MKLRYDFKYVDMGDMIAAVPIVSGDELHHLMLRLNRDGAEMLQAVQESATPEDALGRLCRQNPDMDRDELGQSLCDFLNQLIAEGILEP